MADSLYQVLSEIQVSREDIIEAEDFSKQYLQSLYPDLDLREGVALRDLVLRPFATLVALLTKGLGYYFANNTLAGVTDDSPEDIVDKLLSNFFLVRNQGSSSVVRARLYFLTNNRDIYLSPVTSFSTDNVTFFRPPVEVFITSDSLTYDPQKGEYYYDLDLQSTSQDAAANVESGEFIYFSNFDPYFVSAHILYLSEKAVSKETNTQFLERAQTAVSTRNLINDVSIQSAIKQTFNYITEVVPVGYGDSEMKRDVVTVQNPAFPLVTEQLHIGGKVDVYVNSEVDEKIETFTTDENGACYIEADTNGGSLIAYKIQRVASLDTVGGVPANRAYTVTVGGYDLDGIFQPTTLLDYGFSSRQVVKVQFASTNINQIKNKKASFRVFRFTDVKTVQDYLSSNSTRVVCADQLAVGLDRLEVNLNVRKVGPGTSAILSQAESDSCVQALTTFFKAQRAGQRLVITELLDVLRNSAGLTNVSSTTEVSVKGYTKNNVYKIQDENGTANSADAPVVVVTAGYADCTRTQRFVLGTVTSTL